eukprot:1741291-Lingulodinium_polyedra.AAC.1
MIRFLRHVCQEFSPQLRRLEFLAFLHLPDRGPFPCVARPFGHLPFASRVAACLIGSRSGVAPG